MLFKLKAIKVFLRLISLGEQIVKMPKQMISYQNYWDETYAMPKQGWNEKKCKTHLS